MSSEIRMHVNTDFNIRYYLWKTKTKKIVNFICFCRKKQIIFLHYYTIDSERQAVILPHIIDTSTFVILPLLRNEYG